MSIARSKLVVTPWNKCELQIDYTDGDHFFCPKDPQIFAGIDIDPVILEIRGFDNRHRLPQPRNRTGATMVDIRGEGFLFDMLESIVGPRDRKSGRYPRPILFTESQIIEFVRKFAGNILIYNPTLFFFSPHGSEEEGWEMLCANLMWQQDEEEDPRTAGIYADLFLPSEQTRFGFDDEKDRMTRIVIPDFNHHEWPYPYQ